MRSRELIHLGYYDGATELYEYGWGEYDAWTCDVQHPDAPQQPTPSTSADSTREKLSSKL